MKNNREKFTPHQIAEQRRAKGFYPPGDGKTHTREEWEKKFFDCGSRCRYCNEPLTLETATKDHLTPLCRNGSDGIDNIAPACHPCNSMKSWRTEAEFIADLPRLSKKLTAHRSFFKPISRLSLEEKMNEPGLLKKVVNERERVSWSWRNPA